jgi:hypothetical protein
MSVELHTAIQAGHFPSLRRYSLAHPPSEWSLSTCSHPVMPGLFVGARQIYLL